MKSSQPLPNTVSQLLKTAVLSPPNSLAISPHKINILKLPVPDCHQREHESNFIF